MKRVRERLFPHLRHNHNRNARIVPCPAKQRTARTPNVIRGQFFMILIECEKLTDRMPSEIIPIVTN